MSPSRVYRAGESLDDYCRACKTDRLHSVIAADQDGTPLRVVCGFCRSEHNYRGGPRIDAPSPPRASTSSTPRVSTQGSSPARESFPLVSDRERIAPAMPTDATADL